MAQESGTSSDKVADELSPELPRAVDEKTPTGQLPTTAGRPTI